MSAKNAAAALVEFDCDIGAAVAEYKSKDSYHFRNEVQEFITEHVKGTWTLSLAAAAAGCTEQQVIAALLYYHLKVGTTVVCQMEAREIMEGEKQNG